MWDKFRKALPKIAAALSAVKAWGGALLEGKGLDNAGMIAEEKYKDALRSNRFRRVISQGIAQVKDIAEGVASELGWGGKSPKQDSGRESSAEYDKERASENAKLAAAQFERAKPEAYKRCVVALRHGIELQAYDIRMVNGTLTQEQYKTKKTNPVGLPTAEEITSFRAKMKDSDLNKSIDKIKVKDVHAKQEYNLDPASKQFVVAASVKQTKKH